MSNYGLTDVTNESDVNRLQREVAQWRDLSIQQETYVKELRAERTARRLEYAIYFAVILPVIIIGIAFAYFIYQHALAVL